MDPKLYVVTSPTLDDVRAEISARPDGTYEIELQRRLAEPDGQGGTFLVWVPVGRTKTILASREHAEEEARRRIEAEGGPRR